jgi:hypothetical protein
MNHSIIRKLLPVFVAMLLLVVFLTGGRPATAEILHPDLESPNVTAQPVRYIPISHPDTKAPLAPDAIQSYFSIPGSIFLPMDSATTLAYDSFGCVHLTAGAGNLINALLDIPDGATLVGMRMFYDDTNTITNLTGAITRFNSDGTEQELIKSVSSSYADGHGYNYIGLDNHIVDTYSWTYVLTVYFDNVASSTLQICSFLISYYAP